MEIARDQRHGGFDRTLGPSGRLNTYRVSMEDLMFQWLVLSVIAVLGVGCSSNKKVEAPAPDANPAAPIVKSAPDSKAAHAGASGKSSAKTATTMNGSKVECAVKGDSRILEIRGKGNGCELGYTKGGQEGIVASGSNGSSHCEKTMAKIKERLQGSGFTCQ